MRASLGVAGCASLLDRRSAFEGIAILSHQATHTRPSLLQESAGAHKLRQSCSSANEVLIAVCWLPCCSKSFSAAPARQITRRLPTSPRRGGLVSHGISIYIFRTALLPRGRPPFCWVAVGEKKNAAQRLYLCRSADVSHS